LLQLLQRFCQLRAGAIQISVTQMMEPDGGLDEPLIEQSQWSFTPAPQVLPSLVRFKIAACVKKIYSSFQ